MKTFDRFSKTGLIVALLAAVLVGCVEPGEPLDASEQYGQPEHATVQEPLAFTDEPYANVSGEMSIADLQGLFNQGAFIWYGFGPGDPYPAGDTHVLDADCSLGRFDNIAAKVDELPATIAGVVTLHPRYFQKVSVCGQDQRFYGAFYLEDETGGILVLKDSRIADFTFGNRVQLRVRGLIKSFDTIAVLAFDQQEVVEPDTKHALHYEAIDREFTDEDIGTVRRINGVVAGVPTNANFNELILETEDGSKRWVVSLDRELGLRGIPFEKGRRVQLTGPVEHSFGARTMIIASLGQIEWLDQ